MDQWIAPDRLFDGHNIHTDMAIRIEAGKVVDIGPRPANAPAIKGLLTPGLVDLQVNGGGGAMLNSSPTVDGIRTILQAHRQFGTTALMPTVITDHPDVLSKAADAAISAKDHPGMIGLHIEGPHIAAAKRGTHAEHFIRPLDNHTIDLVTGLRAADVRVMITLAPEAATPDQISILAHLGAIVSLGHTDASADQMRAAMQAGATCATHLFNAMSQMQGRAPGAVGAVITGTCYAGIICDGHHVNDSMIGLAIRGRPVPDRTFLVSDAMATVGGPDHFDLYGQTIRVQDGKLINAEGALAGAHTTQIQGLQRLVAKTGTPLQTALRMVTSVPANCINAPSLGQLIGHQTSDILILNSDLSIQGTLSDILLTSPVSSPP